MAEQYKYIGKSIPIHDVEEKVTGKAIYAGDMELHGMLHAKLIYSTVSHGIVRRIDTSKAEALPGVVKIFTFENSTDKMFNSHKWYSGLDVIEDEQLFNKEVKFIGDRIGAVVAKDRYTAEKAVRLIEVEYEHLPAVVDPVEALDADGYFIARKEIFLGDADEVFKDAEIVIEDRIETPKIHHAAMETHVAVAAPDGSGGMIVWSPCQVVYQIRVQVSELLGLPMDRVRAIKSKMGGSFGGKGQTVLEPICAYLSHQLNKPVKIVLDRTESILSSRTRTRTIGTVKTAVDHEGNILARDIHMLVDTGAYYTNATAVTMAMAKKSFRLYRLKNQKFIGDIVYTNTPIAGAARGYGSPQVHAVTEVNMDNIAKRIGMDPTEFRIKNLVHPYDKDPFNGPELGNARVIDCVRQGVEAFNWKERWSRPKDAGRIVRGVGMAVATHGNGYHGGYLDFITVNLRLNEDGTVFLNAGFHDQGCGTITTMQQIVAEVLDVDPTKIYAPEADTLVSPYDSAGTQASRVTYVCGAAAMIVAEQVKEKFVNYSAHIFECKPEDIRLENGSVINQNSGQRMSYGDMVIAIHMKIQDDVSASYTHTAKSNPGVYCANFVEVEIDTYTGLTRVIDCLAVHDIGRAINKGFVEGQIQGAIQMGIGFALTEEIKIEKNGKIEGDKFSKYHVINAPDMPDVNVILIEDGENDGPFGAKSVGELATCAIAPAVVNAINHALDVNITSMPVTPEKIVEALKNKKKLIK